MRDELKEFKLSKKVMGKLRNRELLKKELAAGKSAQELMEFSDDTMAKFYHAAYQLFEGKKYEEAANAFLFLISLNAYRHEYWLGLGMSLQMCGDFETAIDSYEMAAILDVDNPVAYFYLAKCLFAIHDRESALQALDLAIEYSGDSEQFSELKGQAAKARKLLLT